MASSGKLSDGRRGAKGTSRAEMDGKHAAAVEVKQNRENTAASAAATPVPASTPCGACKFLRRKCISGCIFAPYFGTDQGAARFAAVHKVFGASNVSKLLLHIPANRRQDAVVTICYEAQARLSDPVYGCVSTIITLQQQVASLQTELSMVQTQLINSRFAGINAIQNFHQQHFAVLQPAYSNNSSASSNLLNLSNLSAELCFPGTTTQPSRVSLEPLRLSQPTQDEDDQREEDSENNPAAFANGVFCAK